MIVLTGTVFAFSENNDDIEYYGDFTEYFSATPLDNDPVSTTTFSTSYVDIY